MAWFYLAVAGLLEIAWAVGLKYTDGWTKPGPSAATAAGMVASFYFLSKAIQAIPVGTAYAVWTGIGAVGTAILGVVLFKEPATAARVGCLLLIVAGIAGLKLTAAP